MSSINNIAIAAHRRREGERRARELEQDRVEEERRQFQQRQLQDLLDDSPLLEWFPGIEWEIYLPEDGIVVPMDRVSGTNPELTTVTLKLTRRAVKHPDRPDTHRVEVEFASSASDSDTHYTYWRGPVMNSAADIGEALEARIKAAGDRWLGHKCWRCGMRGMLAERAPEQGPIAYQCKDAEVCARRKELFDSGQAERPA